MTGTVNGVQMTQGFLLIAGILLEIPIVMVVLSRVLRYRVNRWANISAGVISIVFILSNGANDFDDLWFLMVGVLALAFIIWYAWTWPNPKLRPSHSSNTVQRKVSQ